LTLNRSSNIIYKTGKLERSFTMKKSFIFTGVILAAIILIELISTVTNKVNPPYVYAYDPTYPTSGTCVNNGYYTSPNLVNDFDSTHTGLGPSCVMQSPPIGSELDFRSWIAGQNYVLPAAYPTPIIYDCGNGSCGAAETCPPPPPVQICFPNPRHAEGYLRMEWSGQNSYSPQYISLPQSLFENDNCSGSTYPNPCPTPSGNWSNYGYLEFFAYCNFQANFSNPTVLQTVQLYDGNITITSGAITVGIQGKSIATVAEPWIYDLSVSLNYLANQYDVASGRYFSVSNIADVIIPAPNTDYTGTNGMPTPTISDPQFGPNTRSLIMYYDYLTLGASTDLPYYDTPQNLVVNTAYNSSPPPVAGAFIGWSMLGTGAIDYATAESTYSSVSWVPVTGYHIYRSLAHVKNVGPYIPIGVATCTTNPNTPGNVTFFVDTTCPGGNTFCYRVLALNNGPTSDWNNEKTNTINANYNEPLLNATNVVEICGYVLPPATPTNTPVNTATPCGGGCPSPTITPIPTTNITPEPTEAFVYPNPFNPRAIAMGYGGSGVFHVGNVADGTTIHIYSMDGALVFDGVYNAANGGFTWNGKNKNGSLVVSGLYYLVLKDPKSNKTAVFRIIVCYKCNPVYSPGP
jgi:hypothetical protein